MDKATSIYFSPKLKKQIKQLAKEQKRSFSAQVVFLLEQQLSSNSGSTSKRSRFAVYSEDE